MADMAVQDLTLFPRVGRVVLPKTSYLAGALSKVSVLWSGAAFVGDGIIMGYTEYQGIRHPHVPACMPDPY